MAANAALEALLISALDGCTEKRYGDRYGDQELEAKAPSKAGKNGGSESRERGIGPEGSGWDMERPCSKPTMRTGQATEKSYRKNTKESESLKQLIRGVIVRDPHGDSSERRQYGRGQLDDCSRG